jgi:hypothetical protein
VLHKVYLSRCSARGTYLVTYTHIGLPMYPGAQLGKPAYPHAPQGRPAHMIHKVYLPTCSTRYIDPRASQGLPTPVLRIAYLPTCFSRSTCLRAPQGVNSLCSTKSIYSCVPQGLLTYVLRARVASHVLHRSAYSLIPQVPLIYVLQTRST